MNKKQLWLRLKDYDFDDLVPANLWEHLQARFGGSNIFTKAFAHKVARKRGWNNAFALRAVWEYKKFVYLGVVSEFVVTPSLVIDQVWHQHLLFSRAYRNFCQNIIQYDFDHNPEWVSMYDQTGIFNAQYLDTLELYKKEFDLDPPANIWGVPKFDEQAVPATTYRSKKKKEVMAGSDSGGSYEATPLYASFDASASDSFSDFTYEGGDGGGGGASDSWGSDGSSDSSSGDSGSCSSCSSGCGGGD